MTTKKRMPRSKLATEFKDLAAYEWQEVMPGVVSNKVQSEDWFTYLAGRIEMLQNDHQIKDPEWELERKYLLSLVDRIQNGRLHQEDRDRIQEEAQRLGRSLGYLLTTI